VVKKLLSKTKNFFTDLLRIKTLSAERMELVFQLVFKISTGQLKLSAAGSIPALSAIFFNLLQNIAFSFLYANFTQSYTPTYPHSRFTLSTLLEIFHISSSI